MPFYPGVKQEKLTTPLITSKLKLHSADPSYFCSDELYKIIPEILSPNGIVWCNVNY